MKSIFRGVVWPRQKVQHYRYIVIGMVVSDEPIPEFEGKNDIVLDGSSPGLIEALSHTEIRRPPKQTLGDANMVLLSLNDI